MQTHKTCAPERSAAECPPQTPEKANRQPQTRSGDTRRGSPPRAREGRNLRLRSPLIAGLLAVTLASPASLVAGELNETIVYGFRPESLKTIPRSVSVITREEIERASSASLTDLIARETNVNVQNLYGHDKQATVDLRGFGGTASNNTLVLIDGLPVNAPDLSGSDFTTLPLQFIERIEVIRGAASARFGEGATGGVINIITREGRGRREARLTVRGGSYDTNEAAVTLADGVGPLQLEGSFTHFQTQGYRDNGELNKKDYRLGARFTPTPGHKVALTATFHEDKYGLAGSLPPSVFRGSDAQQRATVTPDDAGDTEDLRLRGDLTSDLGALGELAFSLRYRHRRNDYLFANFAFDGAIEEDTITTRVDLTRAFALTDWLGADVSIGGRHTATDYAGYGRNTAFPAFSSVQFGQIDDLAGYAAVEFSVTEAFRVDVAWRSERRVSAQRTEALPAGTAVTAQRDDRYGNGAYDIGVAWSPIDELTVFGSVARGYRNPVVDELAASDPGLGPQQTRSVEAGLRLAPLPGVEFEATRFVLRSDDEILFDPTLPGFLFGANTNADERIIRRGTDLALRVTAIDRIDIALNMGTLDARFANTGLRVPLVPDLTVSGHVAVDVTDRLRAELNGRHVSESVDAGGAFFGENDPYTVVNLRLDLTLPTFGVLPSESTSRLSFGVNNLFDERYSTLASFGEVFPMPDRNVWASLSFAL